MTMSDHPIINYESGSQIGIYYWKNGRYHWAGIDKEKKDNTIPNVRITEIDTENE